MQERDEAVEAMRREFLRKEVIFHLCFSENNFDFFRIFTLKNKKINLNLIVRSYKIGEVEG